LRRRPTKASAISAAPKSVTGAGRGMGATFDVANVPIGVCPTMSSAVSAGKKIAPAPGAFTNSAYRPGVRDHVDDPLNAWLPAVKLAVGPMAKE